MAKEMIIMTQQKRVPVVAVGGDFMVGFDQGELDRLLA